MGVPAKSATMARGALVAFHDVAGGGLHYGRSGELFPAPGAELGELSSAGQKHEFEGSDCAVVAFHRGIEAAANFVEIFGEDRDPIIQRPAERPDFLRVL